MMAARFNPRTAEWETGTLATPTLSTGVRTQPRTQPVETPKRIDVVASIGNFIALAYDKLRNITTLILTWGAWIFGAIGLISWMCDGNWIAGIIIGLLLGYAYVHITAGLATVASWLLFIPLAILRYIFYNSLTLMAALAIAGFAIYKTVKDYTPAEPIVAELMTPYKCTANVLYVLDEPSPTAHIMGSLFNGEEVDVIDYYHSPDFARINYKEHTAYVSTQYISQY